MANFKVSWTVETDGDSTMEAANRAHDLLRSQAPIVLTVEPTDGSCKPVDVIPKLEQMAALMIEEQIPDADVSVDIEDKGIVSITVVSDAFEAIPTDDARIAIVSSLFASFPEDLQEKIVYGCYTPDEVYESDSELE